MESLFIQALVFSTLVIGGLALLVWWLFLSTLGHAQSAAASLKNVVVASPLLSLRLATLIGISTVLIAIGGYWDLSEHVLTGIIPGGEDFLWPPHLMIYASFLLAFLVAIGGTVALAIPNIRAGVRDPRLWARRNPYVTATVIAAAYALLSVPSDAIWHELYGIDKPWSPPHILLALATASLPIAAVGLMGRAQFSGRMAPWTAFMKVVYLALAMNPILIIAVVEWEVAVEHVDIVIERPAWVFPLLVGAVSYFFMLLARRSATGPWAATMTSLVYYAIRIGSLVLVNLLTGLRPRLTLVFIIGALFMDLAAIWMDRKGIRNGWLRAMALAAAFTVGYVPFAVRHLNAWLSDVMEAVSRYDLTDMALVALLNFLVAVALYPLAKHMGDWLYAAKKFN